MYFEYDYELYLFGETGSTGVSYKVHDLHPQGSWIDLQ